MIAKEVKVSSFKGDKRSRLSVNVINHLYLLVRDTVCFNSCLWALGEVMIHKHSIKQKFQFTVASEVISHCFPSPGAANEFKFPVPWCSLDKAVAGAKPAYLVHGSRNKQQYLGEGQNIFV